MENKYEELVQIINSLDNLTHAIQLPLPDSMHVEVLRESLPEKVNELKKTFEEITGENPWSCD